MAVTLACERAELQSICERARSVAVDAVSLGAGDIDESAGKVGAAFAEVRVVGTLGSSL